MRAFFTLILLLLAAPVHADSELRQGADWVRISASPCEDAKVVALLQAAGEDPADYRAARAPRCRARPSPAAGVPTSNAA